MRGEGKGKEGGGGKGKQKGRTTRGRALSLLRCALETTEHHYLMLYSAENRDRKPMFHISPLFFQQQRLSCYIFLVPTLKSMFKAAWMDINMSETYPCHSKVYNLMGGTRLVIGGWRKANILINKMS